MKKTVNMFIALGLLLSLTACQTNGTTHKDSKQQEQLPSVELTQLQMKDGKVTGELVNSTDNDYQDVEVVLTGVQSDGKNIHDLKFEYSVLHKKEKAPLAFEDQLKADHYELKEIKAKPYTGEGKLDVVKIEVKDGQITGQVINKDQDYESVTFHLEGIATDGKKMGETLEIPIGKVTKGETRPFSVKEPYGAMSYELLGIDAK